MRDYLIEQRKEEKAQKKAKKSKGKTRHKGETPEERRARKVKKKERKSKKVKSEGLRRGFAEKSWGNFSLGDRPRVRHLCSKSDLSQYMSDHQPSAPQPSADDDACHCPS